MPGIVTSQSPSYTLPMRYMLTGVIAFGLFALDLLIESMTLGRGVVFTPAVVALTHLLTLGVLLSFVMGAVYQLVTVAFLIPIRFSSTARLNYWAYLIAVIGLWISMRVWWVTGLLVFGTLAVLSLYVYVVIVMASIVKSPVRGAMRGFVQAAHSYLAVAITFAWLMILSFNSGVLSRFMNEMLISHILFAVSFFTFLIFGFTYKLLPMFTLSHGFATYREKYTLTLLHGTLWLLLAAAWLHFTILYFIGAAVGVLAFALQVWDMREMLKKRMRKKIEQPIRFVNLAPLLGGVVALFLIVVLAAQQPGGRWQGLLTFYLLGWIVLTVMGYSYKIVPFLVWTKRFGKKIGREKTPTIAELLNLEKSRWMFYFFVFGLVITVFSLGFTSIVGTIVGTILIAVGIVLYLIHMLHVLDLRKLPKELTQDD